MRLAQLKRLSRLEQRLIRVAQFQLCARHLKLRRCRAVQERLQPLCVSEKAVPVCSVLILDQLLLKISERLNRGLAIIRTRYRRNQTYNCRSQQRPAAHPSAQLKGFCSHAGEWWHAADPHAQQPGTKREILGTNCASPHPLDVTRGFRHGISAHIWDY